MLTKPEAWGRRLKAAPVHLPRTSCLTGRAYSTAKLCCFQFPALFSLKTKFCLAPQAFSNFTLLDQLFPLLLSAHHMSHCGSQSPLEGSCPSSRRHGSHWPGRNPAVPVAAWPRPRGHPPLPVQPGCLRLGICPRWPRSWPVFSLDSCIIASSPCKAQHAGCSPQYPRDLCWPQ